MAWRLEKEASGKQAIIIDGWEAGIADAPEQGIAMIKNINLISIPGEACVNFKTTQITQPPTGVSGVACVTDTATHKVTWTTGGVLLHNRDAITFGSSTGGVTAGQVYWVFNISGGTFQICAGLNSSSPAAVAVTDANNTFSVITLGKPTHKALDVITNNVFILDANGRAWWVSNSATHITFLGNTTLTLASGDGICANGDYLYVFRGAAIDYLNFTTQTVVDTTPAWTYGWQAISTSTTTGNSHFALVAQDNGIYFCNNQYVGSILAKGGNVVIDPSNSATYTFNASALLLPSVDRATYLAELGVQLLVGGIQNKIYPWDRVSTSFAYPLVLAENYTTRMVTTNSSTYIFAGNRGRIYITNGSNINLFKKVPDQITSGTDPYFTWLDAIYWKNQIYFSFLTADNAGSSITTLGGVWALDVSMNIMGTPTSVALRQSNTLSGGVTDYPYVIAPNITTTTPAGAGLFIGWSTGSVHGVDTTTSTPYSDYSTAGGGGEIYTDLIPTGTFIFPETFSQIEFKLSTPLVSGDAVKISAHQSYSTTWVSGDVVGSTTTVGAISDKYAINFQKGQWLQLYIQLQATGSSPSYCRLKEVRLR